MMDWGVGLDWGAVSGVLPVYLSVGRVYGGEGGMASMRDGSTYSAVLLCSRILLLLLLLHESPGLCTAAPSSTYITAAHIHMCMRDFAHYVGWMDYKDRREGGFSTHKCGCAACVRWVKWVNVKCEGERESDGKVHACMQAAGRRSSSWASAGWMRVARCRMS
jgi:hypothetical protein